MSNHTLLPNPNNPHHFFIPETAPFYLNSLNLSIVATAKGISGVPLGISTVLVEGVDYQPAFLFNQATGSLGEAVYGGILFTDPKLAGQLTYTLTPIGGYTSTELQRISIQSNALVSPLSNRWESVIPNLPTYSAPELTYASNPLVTVKEVASSIAEVAVALGAVSKNPTVFDFTRHVEDSDNPHGDTSTTIGLGQVPNWDIASVSEIVAGNVVNRFVTPAGLYGALLGLIQTATPTLAGRVALNLGTTINDNYNSVDVLTASGLLSMLRNGLMDDVLSRIENPRPTGQFFPFPVIYPAVYNRKFCYSFKELVIEVQKLVGIAPLTYSAATGTVYFPNGVTIPSMSLQRRSTVRSRVNKPLFY